MYIPHNSFLETKIHADFKKYETIIRTIKHCSHTLTPNEPSSETFTAYYLPPANKVWGKVIFLHLSVILFTGGSTWAGTPRQVHSPWQVYPPAGIPPPTGTPSGRYTPQATPPPSSYTSPPQAGTPPGQVPPWQCMLGYGQQAGSKHPTGMHSCFTIGLQKFADRWLPRRVQWTHYQSIWP